MLVVAAILGSTGVAGLLSGGVQWSRAARLRHSADRTTSLIAKVGSDTAAGKALALASQRDAIRLSVMSIIQIPGEAIRTLIALVAMLILVAVATFIAYARASTNLPDSLFSPLNVMITGTIGPISLGFMMIYVVAIVWVMDTRLRAKREKLAWAILESNSISQEMIEEHDFRFSTFRRAVTEKSAAEPVALGG